MATWNGINIVPIPTQIANALSIEWAPMEAVAATTDPFSGQQQTFDWQGSWLEGTLSYPIMTRADADAAQAFLLSLRGPLNAFLFGDPTANTPKGSPSGAPVVNGAGQGVLGSGVTPYQVITLGWAHNVNGLLLPGDYISIYPRLYRVTGTVNSDGSGNATIPIWPNLRDAPASGASIVTSNCQGLFRLAQGKGNSFSSTLNGHGLTGIKIREAI